jgi:hypothetical protein
MARVLVVSRNPAMAMGLSATDYEVVDLRPPSFGEWISGADDADALILDLENPRLAVAAVTNLRAHAKLAPVLLVSSDRPGWDDPEMRQLPAAQVLPLPISKLALLSALQDLIVEPWAHQTIPPHHVGVTEALQELVLDPDDLLDENDDLGMRLGARETALEESDIAAHAEPAGPLPADDGAARSNDTEPLTLGSYPGKHAAVPADAFASTVLDVPSPASSQLGGTRDDDTVNVESPPVPPHYETPPLSAVPRTRRSTTLPEGTTTSSLRDMEALRPTEQSKASTSANPRRHERTSTPGAPVGAGARAAHALDDSAQEEVGPAKGGDYGPDLVRRLSRVAHTLIGVPETSDVVLLDAVERTHADAGALMVPDGGAWRVAAGKGLRPLEHRYQLHAESWLVQQVARAHKGAIIEESDIAREQLLGAPLASWRHLLAAPVPKVEALLLLARRDDPPFDEGDLTVLAGLGNEAGPPLTVAMEIRSLARILWTFRDQEDGLD